MELIKDKKEIISCYGLYPGRKNARKVVAILRGNCHEILATYSCEFLRSAYDRKAKATFDLYRLSKGLEIAK